MSEDYECAWDRAERMRKVEAKADAIKGLANSLQSLGSAMGLLRSVGWNEKEANYQRLLVAHKNIQEAILGEGVKL